MELMAKTPGLYHVPIVDAERKLYNLVTESCVMQFLVRREKKTSDFFFFFIQLLFNNNYLPCHTTTQLVNLHNIGAKTAKPLRHCPKLFKPVIGVRDTSKTIDALRILNDRTLQGLAVTNSEGKLVWFFL